MSSAIPRGIGRDFAMQTRQYPESSLSGPPSHCDINLIALQYGLTQTWLGTTAAVTWSIRYGCSWPLKSLKSATKDLYGIGEVPPLGHVPANMHAWAIRKERHGPPEISMQLEVLPTGRSAKTRCWFT